MRILSKAEILAAKGRLKTERIPTPEWGDDGAVLVRAFTGLQREAMDREVYERRTAGKPYSILGACAAFSIIDEDGQQMFTVDEVLELADLNQGPLERIWDWHQKHSGLGGKALQDAIKNSEPGQNGATPIASSSASAG